MEDIIIKCIEMILSNEGYTPEEIKTIINYNYAELKDMI